MTIIYNVVNIMVHVIFPQITINKNNEQIFTAIKSKKQYVTIETKCEYTHVQSKGKAMMTEMQQNSKRAI